MNANAGSSGTLWRLKRCRAVLELRHFVMTEIRKFFCARGFLEVETPVLVRAPAVETHIEPHKVDGLFLRTSPELEMKKLLAAGYPRIFQIGPCFRKGELGELHRPEYTMLEWYRAYADYRDVLADTKALITHLVDAVNSFLSADSPKLYEWAPIWEILRVSEAFLLHAGWDPCRSFDADRFDWDLVHKVEPALPRDAPVILIDYPAEAAALARIRPGDPPVAERWELYWGGVEIANAYSELNDPIEQRRRFETANQVKRAKGNEEIPVDEEFLEILSYMPPSGGVALGVDRLIMILAGASSLSDVLPLSPFA